MTQPSFSSPAIDRARARELASQVVEDPSERFSAYYGLWGGHLTRGEPAPMREIAELFLREATARPDCPERLIAHRVSGCTCFQFGDFAGAHQHFQKTIELYDQARHTDFADRFGQDPRASAEILDALALWVLGRVDNSLRVADPPSPMPSRQTMLRLLVMRWHMPPSLSFFGATPSQSRPTARRSPMPSLVTISQPIGPASRYFYKAGQCRDWPRCGAASPSIGSKVGFGFCPKRSWPKPKRVPARPSSADGEAEDCPRRAPFPQVTAGPVLTASAPA